MKRIALIGDLRPHTRTHQRYRTLCRMGHAVVGVPTVPLELGEDTGQKPPLVARVRHKLGVPTDPAGANAALLTAVEKQSFDLLWVEKALPLRTAVLARAKALQPWMKLGFMSEDDMVLRWNQSRWFVRSLPLYDVVFTTKSLNARPEELPSLGARRVEYLTKNFDAEVHRPLEVGAELRARLGGPVGFVGTFEEQRAQLALAIARSGIAVRIFGNGWDAWRERHPKLRVEGRPVYGDDYVRTLCATDVNLGFLRKASRDRHTDRSVEIPACAAFLLAERTDEHQALFREGIEADYFEGPLELVRKVHDWLGRPEERRRVAAAGRERCLRDRYDHEAALERMLAALDGQGSAATDDEERIVA